MADEVLQTQLDKAMRIAAMHKKNSELVKAKFDNLKATLNDLESKYQEAKQNEQNANLATEALQRDCGQLYKIWHAHLKRQTDEFAEIKANLVPNKELDMLRIQIAEQMELPHRQQVTQLNQEIHKFRDLYLQTKRHLELLRTEHSHQQENHNAIVDELETSHTAKCNDMNARNLKLQELVEDNTLELKCHQAERETAEAVLRAKQRTDELNLIRTERDDAVVKITEVKLSSGKVVKDLRGELAQATAKIGALNSREGFLKDELAKSTQLQSMFIIYNSSIITHNLSFFFHYYIIMTNRTYKKHQLFMKN